MGGSILNREDYKTAIPQLSSQLNDLLENNVIINRTVITLSEGKVSDLNTYLGYFQNLTTGYFQAIAGDIEYLSSREAYINHLKTDIASFGYITAETADLRYATISNLNAAVARIGDLEADHVSVSDFTAATGRISDLEADHVSVADLTAATGRIGALEADHVSVSDLAATNADVAHLKVGDLTIGGVTVNIYDLAIAIKNSAMASGTTWYKVSASTPTAPAVFDPTADGWSQTEPAYVGGTTDHLYSCLRVVYADDDPLGTRHFQWSDVHMIQSWEAASIAYGYADAANGILDDMETAATAAGTTLEGIYADAEASKSTLADMEAAATAASTTLTDIYADAETAKTTTDEIEAYAATVSKTVTQVLADGETAGAAAAQAVIDAGEAKAAASNASEYAARALGNLSTVQSVAETLDWITAHGTMTLTSDVALDPTHVYFVVDVAGDYEVGGTHYSVVTEPDVADIATYYELSIDESLNNYVGTHLAVTSEGLWLIPEDNATPQSSGKKVLIAVGGQGHTYQTAGTYIIEKVNGADEVVAKFTADGATVGSENGAHSTVDENGMQVYSVDNNLAIQLAHIGYGDVQSASGTLDAAPYYIFGPLTSAEAIIIEDLSSGAVVYAGVFYKSRQTNREYICIHNSTSHDVSDTDVFVRIRARAGALSVKEGEHTFALGYSSHAEGGSDTRHGGRWANLAAVGGYSHAEGLKCIAAGDGSHAEGESTGAYNRASHAEGQGAEASGENSHAEGFYTKASGDNSHAQNQRTRAQYENQTAIGKYNDNKSTSAFEIGNGTSINDYSNAFEVDWSGNVLSSGDVEDGSGNVLSNKADQSSVPTATSQLTNDSGFLTEDSNGDLSITRNINAGGDVTDGNNNVLANKADSSDVYTKTQTDNLLADKADTTDLADYLPLTGGTLTGALNGTDINVSGNVYAQGMAGMIQMFAGATPPTGWLACDGSEVAVDDYPTLHRVIGTTYNDGTETSGYFRLPNLTGRFPVGAGSAYALNSQGGSEYIQEHSHSFTNPTVDNGGGTNNITGGSHHHATYRKKNAGSGSAIYIPDGGSTSNGISTTDTSHTHSLPNHTHRVQGGAVGVVAGLPSGQTTGNQGNLPPYIGINFIICTGEIS